jgi:hypothetical protein
MEFDPEGGLSKVHVSPLRFVQANRRTILGREPSLKQQLVCNQRLPFGAVFISDQDLLEKGCAYAVENLGFFVPRGHPLLRSWPMVIANRIGVPSTVW